MIKTIFDKMFLLQQKSILVVEKKKLEEELKKIGKFPSYGDSEEDNAQEVEEFSGSIGMEKQLRNLLKEVKVALEKIDNHSYGICQSCHDPIDKARLRAFPAAPNCMEHSK